MNSLSRVSHAFRAQCEPIIFHSITLCDDKKRALRISNRILGRLENPKDSLVHNVRHITVGYTSDQAVLPEKSLLQALRNVQVLKSLTWRTWLPVTAEILDSLRKTHPSARVSVIAHERNNLPLDEALLSSTQLHTLDIKLSALYDKNFRKPMGKSELKNLKTLVMQGGSLRVLRLRFEKIKHGSRAARNRFQGYGPSECEPVAFKFEDGEMLPALEELVLRDMFSWGEHQTATTNACEAWKTHQDWSSLRTLDLRLDGGEEMLRCLTTAVPQLQTLKVKMKFHGHPIAATLDDFLQSVHHLTHLHVECDSSISLDLLQTVYRTVSHHLISLYMEMDSNLVSWRQEQFLELFSRCSQLEALMLDGSTHLVFGAWTAIEAKLPPESKLRHLVQTKRKPVPPRKFATRPSRYGQHIRCTGTGFLYSFYVPEPPNWLGYTESEVDAETKQAFARGQVLAIFDLAFAL